MLLYPSNEPEAGNGSGIASGGVGGREKDDREEDVDTERVDDEDTEREEARDEAELFFGNLFFSFVLALIFSAPTPPPTLPLPSGAFTGTVVIATLAAPTTLSSSS